MSYLIISLQIILMILMQNCGPIPDYRTLAETDIQPPVFLGIKNEQSDKIILLFNEPAEKASERIILEPELEISSTETSNNSLIIILKNHQSAGTKYHIEAAVKDIKGNSLNFITSFYGYNSELPTLIINEFITRGSGKHPDLVELFIQERGNMAGICLFEGTSNNWTHQFIFPSIEVDAGSYILIHFKPQGILEEINESDDLAESGGYDSSPDAWDFWIEGGKGISGNNGVISIYCSPYGELLDGVLYSNRTSSSDENYRGFGTKKVMERADQLFEDGGWLISSEQIAPEDAISPEGSTSTRSICRSSTPEDSDSTADWHIVPTSGSTFGEINIDEVYEK